MNTEPTTTDIPDVFRPDSHYQHLHSAIAPWLRQALPHRRTELSKVTPTLPATLRHAPPHQHAALNTLVTAHALSQNRTDRLLANLRNPADFAEPLLQALIKTRCGLELDVRQTCLRLYLPDHVPWLRMKSGAARIWTLSLLDAALHNFENSETEQDAFEPASTYTTPASPTGQFDTLPQILQKMPIATFTRLCRELDIGQRYKEYLEDNLGISNPVTAALLQPALKDSQRAALTAALHMAHMQNLLAGDAHQLILGLLDNLPHLRLRGQNWGCRELTLMNARLTGILMFAPEPEQAREVVSVVVYLPDDPAHPIKQYPSSAAFAEELGRRLREPDYQAFFSRFIDHQERGHFFAQLNDQLAPITWQPVQRGDPRPTWREQPNRRPGLHLRSAAITGELWTHLYQSKLNKILNDARVIAVPTATVDQRARWALWDSFSEITSTLLNIAAFIALPFVPFLGELMLGYMAYQLLDETFEGIIDWAEGEAKTAFGHFMEVVQSAVQLGTFAAGGVIAAGEFRALLPREIVQFIDRFNWVKRPSGKTRYWKPDLSTYSVLERPGESKPDTLGLHSHQGKTLLVLDNKCYVVSKDTVTSQHRIDHPSRPDAYKPLLETNGAGAWLTELDQPLSWDQATALRRMGPDMERFSASERERMLTISGCDANALRKMHVNAEQVPPLLADTLKRFKIDRDIQTFIEQIGSETTDDYLKADPVLQLQILKENGYWPENKNLQLTDGKAHILWQSHLRDAPGIRLDTAQLHQGDLLKTFLLALSDSEIRAMSGEAFGHPSLALETRTRTLRRTLAELAERRRASLFDERYRKFERGADSQVREIMGGDRSLPISVAEAILDSTSAQERQQLQRSKPSKRLAEMIQEARMQVRMARAYEGLELQSSAGNRDTERLALHSLPRLPDWPEQLRLEIRHYAHEGPLLDSIGPKNAPTCKVLVLTELGEYQAFDHAGQELSGAGGLYPSLLRALPDAERQALNIRIGEEQILKQRIRDHALNRDDLRSLLAQHPNLKPAYDPTFMRLLGGTDGYRHIPVNTPPLQFHAQRLFPQLSAEELLAFVEKLQRHPDGPRAELSRLFAEHDQLSSILNPWTDDIPEIDPNTRTRLTTEQFAIQRQNRRYLRREIYDCWRQQATYPDHSENTIEFRFWRPILGELPRLSINFNRVDSLMMGGHSETRGVHEFLKHFSGLRHLDLRTFNLGFLPEAIDQSPRLSELILSDCAITLTAESLMKLSALDQLTTLDLYKNPLGLMPRLERMPRLDYVDVSATGISEFPTGLLNHPRIRTALLNDNRLEVLPTTLFELPDSITEGIDLGGNPITASDHERIKSHFARTRHDFGVLADQDDLLRVQTLYTQMDREQASEFVYLLPGTLADGKVEITRLENEYSALRDSLAAWTADVPAIHPISGQPFTPHQLSNEHLIRDEFRNRLEQCWRRESDPEDIDPPQPPIYELNLSAGITGELPELPADFAHVTHLYMRSRRGRTSGATRFLERFPNLKHLTIYEYQLGNIPEAIFRMADLTHLALSGCHITLTEQTALELAQMERLDLLDLSDNPLGRTPDISQMTDLTVLLLDSTDISELPHGLLQLKNLRVANLNDNAIAHIPSDILELPLEFAGKINLRDNPLDEESVQRLIAYFRRTNVDFGVIAVIDSAEMEVSTSEDSEVDE